MNIIDAVRRLALRAKPNYIQAIESGGPLFVEYGLTTPLRQSHFLAQAMHETGGFSILRESGSYSAKRLVEIFGVGKHTAAITAGEATRLANNGPAIFERVYGLGNPRKALELGNTRPGDGWLFRGNGVLQTTGGGNHKRVGDKCGIDFYNHPDLVTAPEHALKPALIEWKEGNLNAKADANLLNAITKKINGGYNGLADRQAWFNKIWPLLRDTTAPAWQAAEPDHGTRWLQESLNALGASPALKVDGKAGPATAAAVRKLQKINGLKVDGIAGPVTIAMMELRLSTTRAAA